MERMSEAQWREFVLCGTRTGKVALARGNGLPHVTPIWFLLDDSPGAAGIVFTTWSHSVKGRLLLREPRFSVCVDDQRPPYSYVLLECHVREIVRDPEKLFSWASRIGARYMGPGQADTYGRRNSVLGELLVYGAVDKVIALSGIAD